MPFELKRFGKVWHIYGTEHGVRIRQSTGCAERANAELSLSSLRARVFDEVVLGKAPQNTKTFAEAVRAYRQDGGCYRFLQLIEAQIGEKKLAQIDQECVSGLARKLYPEAAPATINRQLITPISAVMNCAARLGWCDPPRLQRRSEPKSTTPWLTPAQADALIASCNHEMGRRVTLYLATGARRAELDTLTWSGVLPGGERIEFRDMKSDDVRAIDLCPRALEALGERGDPDQPVLSPISYSSLSKQLLRAGERAGIGGVRAHMFRHSWATWTYAATRDVSRLVGEQGQPWKSYDMVKRYLKRASDALGAEVRAAGWIAGDGLRAQP